MNPYSKTSKLLPKLPVPDLEQTCKKYLRVIKPIVSFGQYNETEEKLNKFMNGKGIELQERLLNFSSNIEGSWLKPFWDESYLGYRVSTVCNVNPCETFNIKILKKQLHLKNTVQK